MSRSRQQSSLDALNAESSNLRSQIASQVDKADDPLELYDRFVKWIFDNYPSEHFASSGLIELLEEATRRYKDDSSYKGDLRYLKLWTLYASLVDKPSIVFKFILTNGIGTVYALLFEEYALALERDRRHSAADEVYRAGIQRKARPIERLKKKYDEFRRRTSSKPAVSPPAARVTLPKVKGTAEADLLRRQPLKNYDSPSAPAHAPPKSGSSSSSQVSSLPSSSTSQSHTRYSHMLAPPVAGKRPEKLRLDLRLLFTEEHGEYSMAEARARSMGLLGKKWGPPPASELSRDNASTAQVNFNDDGTKNTRSYLARRNLGGSEPTVTINTKAALEDVFGMYNSPEKSTRFSAMPGTKHAPVRAIEPVTPLSLLPQSRPVSEKPNNSTVTPSFTPFIDENAGRKENAAPPKFKPFVDADLQARPPAPGAARRALASKDIGTAAPAPAPKGTSATPHVFSKVFTPVTKEEIKQPPEHSLKPEEQVFQAARENGAPKLSSGKFTFLSDAQAPFKVFSRPPEKVSVFSKPGDPFVDGVSSTASALSSRTPLGTFVPQRTGRKRTQALSEEEEDEDIPPNADMDYEEHTDEYEAPHNTPFGGRFGQFNVMTPITERTLEYTSTGRFIVPDEVSTPGEKATFGEPDAVVAAERLAAEVRRDNVFISEQHAGGRVRNTRNDEATSTSSFVPPFRLSDGHTIPGPDKAENDSRLQATTALVEEKTGKLNLFDEVLGAPAFKPTNPCNPFDPSIISTLLSQLPPNPEHHHSSQESQLLDGLQKFARKQSRTNATSSGQTFSLELGDKRFCVYEKLGEGGFGAVFGAKVVAPKFGGDDNEEEDEDEDEDDDEAHRVAIKVVKPHNIWEFRMLHKAHECLPTRLRSSVIYPQALYTFPDESFLVLDLCTQGSLLDIINHAGPAGVSQQGACLDELLVMGCTAAGIIHGDLKIDNCLVRLEDVPGGSSLWAAQYDPAGAGGWHCKGIKLIDFGRAIDTRMFPRGQAFVAEWATDARDCVEMREGRPWTYQADYFGLAGIVYCMLYGKYIEASSVVLVEPPKGGEGVPRYKLATGFKRYWQADLWTRLFDVLLNPCLVRPDGALPLSDTLALLRAEMQEWLQANCNRSSNTLKGLLKKVELFVIRGH
ncbi:Mad3/BUB1 homology region 1-domain-containing protein [Lactarius vividus]|nr:Mad3/BUB1 homology region 1-domain-containing protein [Lactarius vividus]